MGEQTALALRLDQDKVNVVVPTLYTEDISPFLRLTMQEIRVNPDPTYGDVHCIDRYIKMEAGDSKKVPGYMLTAAKLSQFAAAANLQVNYRESGIIEDTPTRVKAVCIGAVQDATGDWRVLQATKALDLDQLLKMSKTPEQARQKWLYRYEIVETGARLRLIRAALGLKTAYSKEEVSKPFAIVRVTPRLEAPEIREAMLRRAAASAHDVFGPPRQAGLMAALPAARLGASVVDLDAGQPDTGLPEDPDIPGGHPPIGDPPGGPGTAPEPSASGGAGLFPNGSPAPANGQAPSAAPRRAAAPAGHCSNCGVAIPAAVVEFSTRRFHRALCRECQAEQKAGGDS